MYRIKKLISGSLPAFYTLYVILLAHFNPPIITHSDLMAWVNSVQASLSSQELASNVNGAERLLNKHKVRRRRERAYDTLFFIFRSKK